MGNQRHPELSCEFIDHDAPANMAQQFETVQSSMSMIYMELLGCIPKDDLLEEDLAPLSIASGVLLPVVAFAPNEEPKELSEKMLDGLRTALTEQ